jgi:hypothetical protein
MCASIGLLFQRFFNLKKNDEIFSGIFHVPRSFRRRLSAHPRRKLSDA